MKTRSVIAAAAGTVTAGVALGAPAPAAQATPAPPAAAPVPRTAPAPRAVPRPAAVPAVPIVTRPVWRHNVSYGDRGRIVRRIQRIVGVRADGIFGPHTRRAVIRWQGRHGLVRDGIVGPRTAGKMDIRSGGGGSRASRGASHHALWTHNVRYGARGAIVRSVQRIVGVRADGIFGSHTRRAVVRWQGRHGLVRDGIVGPRTAAAMGLRGGSAAGTNASRVPDRASRSSSRTGIRQRIIRAARDNLGVRYTYGGDSPSQGFDCSGYVKYVLGRAGIDISARTAAAQQGTFSGTSNPRPGDLVFFGSPAYHVGIYAGGGQMYTAHKPGHPSTLTRLWNGVSGFGNVLRR
ncbi:MAG TPA: peptidoglycan-binding protein [Segeticoccus sp.]|nr:peptidoglycan-binding protein [Segeticoccus sp.]